MEAKQIAATINLETEFCCDRTLADGCLADDPIIRYPQGEYEQREPIT
ncbi:hypothetical protein KBT16_21830 [Nostoc sp. CCCryo 231-06]|nr:hypothetical protein [Nostoc sp. CCCryo 231-06]